MKKYKSFFLAFFVIVIVASLSSCAYDYYWRTAELNIEFNLNTDRDGYSEATTRVRIEEIPQYNASRDDLMSIRLNDAWIRIHNLYPSDRINRLYIDVVGVGTYEHPYSLYPNSNGDIVIDDSRYFRFMEEVSRELSYRGYVDMKVSFYSNIYNSGPVYFDLSNKLELQIRE